MPTQWIWQWKVSSWIRFREIEKPIGSSKPWGPASSIVLKCAVLSDPMQRWILVKFIFADCVGWMHCAYTDFKKNKKISWALQNQQRLKIMVVMIQQGNNLTFPWALQGRFIHGYIHKLKYLCLTRTMQFNTYKEWMLSLICCRRLSSFRWTVLTKRHWEGLWDQGKKKAMFVKRQLSKLKNKKKRCSTISVWQGRLGRIVCFFFWTLRYFLQCLLFLKKVHFYFSLFKFL